MSLAMVEDIKPGRKDEEDETIEDMKDQEGAPVYV
jgi:hypothetical protein